MKKINNYLFNQLHSKNLIYNTCWEDPKCDRELMQLNNSSNILMITSGGCNALEYLLDDVARIDCVDLNFRQNALLALKIAFFKFGDFDLLFEFFGKGRHKQAKEIYASKIRPVLAEEFRKYWDKKISYFNGRGIRKSFYFRGTSGFLAWGFKAHSFLRPSLRKQVHGVLHSFDFQEQCFAYEQTKTTLFNSFTRKVLDHPVTLSLAGVPQAQAELYLKTYKSSQTGYLGHSFDKVFYELPVKENYFYAVYWNGAYEKNRCPEYLKQENFDTIRQRVNRINWHTMSITDYLNQADQTYSHYVLLDHMDWLAKMDMPALEAEWEAIFNKSEDEARILFRSAADNINWLPNKVRQKITFDLEKCEEVHRQDRVGMYASVWFGKLN